MISDSRTDRLTELRRLAGEATPGEWTFTGDVESMPVTIASDPYADLKGLTAIGYDDFETDTPATTIWERNARYIAAASPSVILALLDELEALRDVPDTIYAHIAAMPIPVDVIAEGSGLRLNAENVRAAILLEVGRLALRAAR